MWSVASPCCCPQLYHLDILHLKDQNLKVQCHRLDKATPEKLQIFVDAKQLNEFGFFNRMVSYLA